MVFDAFVRAGFSEMTSCGLPGEVIGTISDSQLKNPIVRTTLAYGYGLTVTPLQLAQAYLMLATGGVRLPVSILRQRRAATGQREFDYRNRWHDRPDDDGRRFGARHRAEVARAGYEIAGKTGTARKVGPNGYDEDRHVAFFAGSGAGQKILGSS